MAFLGFGAAKRTSVTLIDIDSSTIGGAVMHFTPSAVPMVSYARRTDIDAHEGEELAASMIRTLQEVLKDLVSRGGPILRKETGSGHTDQIIVRIGTPWQKTLIRRERVEEPKPFTFTYAIQRDILRKKDTAPEGFKNLEELVIATLLNGYETTNPYGKQAKHVEIVIASSWIDEKVGPEVQKVVRGAYHTHALTTVTPASVMYTVFRTLFPHEKNYLTLEISGESTEMSYVKNSIMVKASSLDLGVNDIIRRAKDGMKMIPHTPTESSSTIINATDNAKFGDSVEAAEISWIKKIETLFQEFAAEHALPRTIFLIAPEGTREYLSRILDTQSLHSLWLSDEPLRIVALAPSHLTPFIGMGSEADPDMTLGLFALFARSTIHKPLPKD